MVKDLPKRTTETIECETDWALYAPFVIQEVEKSVKEGFDGIVISCYADPGFLAAREIANIPAGGTGHASIKFHKSIYI